MVIGSDQIAVFEDQIIGKPGTRDRAIQQLSKFSGQSVRFLTAVCTCCAETGYVRTSLVASDAHFRVLTQDEINRYIDLDDPLDCAGGFKSEVAGSAILERLRSDDPTAIIGLPLITVCSMLRANGYLIP